MAKKKLPDPLRRRHLVEQELESSRALQIAEAYLEEDRAMEAVAFLLKAEAPVAESWYFQENITTGQI